MRVLIGFISMLLMLVMCISCALGEVFDISIFENDRNLYSVFRENTDVFIEVNLTSEEKNFSHKNDSVYYYNSIFPNIIVLDAGTKSELAIPRIWIYYRTENKALNVKKVEFSIYNSKFTFTIEDSNISALEKGTISEELLIIIDKHCIDEFLGNWYFAATTNKDIDVALIGSTDTVEFKVPVEVANAGAELFLSYAMNVKNTSISVLDYSGTPVLITAKHKPLSEGEEMVYHDVSNRLEFVVPSGWSTLENDDDNSDWWTSIKVRWESADREKHANIRYSASDMYGMMEAQGIIDEEIGINRRDMDNSMITKDVFAEMMEIPENEIKCEKYGDYEYYTYVQKQSGSLANIDTSVELIRYYNFDNGIMYCFSFAGEKTKFGDFEKLMVSVKHTN